MKSLLLGLILSFTVFSSCLAFPGSDAFIVEEIIALKTAERILDTEATYSAVTEDFLPLTLEDFPETRLEDLRTMIRKEFGTVTDVKFLNYTKRMNRYCDYTDVNDIILMGKGSTGKNISFVFTFKQDGNVHNIMLLNVTAATLE